MSDLVSILIPAHNCERWVGAAVRSALQQAWAETEVIVLDDASTDGTWNELQAWSPRVRLERAQRNGGQNASRNHLTDLAKGRWLVFLDADDELAPDSIAEKMSHAGDADAVYGSMEMQYFEGVDLIGKVLVRAEAFPDPFSAAFLWKFPNTSSFLFRRDAVLEVGRWNERIRACTDYDLYFRMLLAGKRFAPAVEALTVYRQWSLQQAVNEDPVLRGKTRLEMMWRAALELELRGDLTDANREAFTNGALRSIRTIFHHAASEGLLENRKLMGWDGKFRPSSRHFSTGYCTAYRWLGFHAAEWLARATRFLRPVPSGDLFPRSRSFP